RHLRRPGTVIRRYRGASQETLIQALRPVITGWSRYYAHVVSKAVFTMMYHRVHHQLRRWALWRHPHKGYRWRMHRYWQRKDGGIVFGKPQTLPQHPATPITRPVKVAGTRRPYHWNSPPTSRAADPPASSPPPASLPSHHRTSTPTEDKTANVEGGACPLPRSAGSNSIKRTGSAHTTRVPPLPCFTATVMIRCTVPMTR